MNDTQRDILEEKRAVMKKQFDYMQGCDPANEEYTKVVSDYMKIADSIDKQVQFEETLYEQQITKENAEKLEREKFEQSKKSDKKKLIKEIVVAGGTLLVTGLGTYMSLNQEHNGVILSKTHQEVKRNNKELWKNCFKAN